MTSYDTAMLILRLWIGLVIFLHGYNHIWGGGKIQGTARWFESMGLKPGIVHAWASGATEVLAGLGLMAGFLTTLDCAAVVSVMAVAFWTNHRPNGFFIFRPGEGYEYVISLLVTAFMMATFGPGKASLDRAFGIDDNLSGSTGAWLALAIGIGSAAFLVITAWRPEKKTTS